MNRLSSYLFMPLNIENESHTLEKIKFAIWIALVTE